MKQSKNQITKRSEDYAKWYLDVIAAADLAEHSQVKGCMIIKPCGYALWEAMQDILNQKFKATGHQNAYFPLFIPKSFLNKEANHVAGFAKECAVVTHYRLKQDPRGEGLVIDPEAKLKEELIVRPTSETIINASYANWVKSWRDLPILINQWANVVRWEMRTRLFLRTAEFLWQEGHTAHATQDQAEEEQLKMINVYKDFAENYLALPVIAGRKSESEKFAGAVETYTIEALMQDGKALQAGTSHHLGQNFARVFNIQFTDQDGALKYVWQTSWGVSTRLIGALIMAHSDDQGLILPPKIAPIKLAVVPIWSSDKERVMVLDECNQLADGFRKINIEFKIDERDYISPGFKFNEWEKKGVPVRIEIGPRDIVKDQVILVRRDTGQKEIVAKNKAVDAVRQKLEEIQANLFERALKFKIENSYQIDNYNEFKTQLEKRPGFIYSHWCGSEKCEGAVSKETKATIRCIPFDGEMHDGRCIKCGGKSERRAVWAKSY